MPWVQKTFMLDFEQLQHVFPFFHNFKVDTLVHNKVEPGLSASS